MDVTVNESFDDHSHVVQDNGAPRSDQTVSGQEAISLDRRSPTRVHRWRV